MLVRPRSTSQQRRGTASVEFAVGSAVFFFVLFGVIEYARFVTMYNVLENATRETARFAIVNTHLDYSGLYNGPAYNKDTRIDAHLRHYLSQLRDVYQNLDVTVTSFIGRPVEAGEVYGQPRPNWLEARVNDIIAIEATADFQPVLPNFLLMGNNIRIRCRSCMFSEAN